MVFFNGVTPPPSGLVLGVGRFSADRHSRWFGRGAMPRHRAVGRLGACGACVDSQVSLVYRTQDMGSSIMAEFFNILFNFSFLSAFAAPAPLSNASRGAVRSGKE